jgi:DinB family protein
VSQVANWFGRKFEFTFPLELYPNLCVRLRGTPARLEELVRDCPRESLVRKSQDKWSIQEQAGHLLDLESLWSARVDDFLGGSGDLTAADLTNRKTHEAGHNSRGIGEITGEFRKARWQLVERVQGLGAEAFGRSLLHPRLQQPMRLVDHLYFAAEHDDHHLARIWELAQHS